jgi:triosephosphate isomerase
MSRKTVIVGNWKMNLGVEESLKFFASLARHQPSYSNVDIVVCPPFTSLYTASVALQETSLKLGAQNCCFEDNGAFTGEISPVFLQELSCEYVIVGHSERRHIFKETNQDIARKLSKAWEHRLIPIFCVGENESEREAGRTFSVIETQLKDGLASREKEPIGGIIIAYEPVWAIGTGKTATPGQAQEVHAFIRQSISKVYGTRYGREMRLLYGGSVKPDNMRTLLQQTDVDGGLVGGASLNPDDFLEIVRQAAGVIKN